jgi:hypothetical protein
MASSLGALFKAETVEEQAGAAHVADLIVELRTIRELLSKK